MSPTTELWYSPPALRELRTRATSAVDEIRHLIRSCNDDAAHHTLRSTALTLEQQLLPVLDQLCSSTSLLEWRSEDPAPTSHRRPAPVTLGGRVATLLRTIDDPLTSHGELQAASSALAAMITRHPATATGIAASVHQPSSTWNRLIRRLADSAIDTTAQRGHHEATARLAASVINTVSTADAHDLLESLATSASATVEGAIIVTGLAPHLSDDRLADLTHTLSTTPALPAVLGPASMTGRRIAIEGLLLAMAERPAAAGLIAADPMSLTMVATDPALHTDTVTQALTAAMHALGPAEVVSGLVTLGPDQLSLGAVRAAAIALAAVIDDLATVIDAPLVRVPGRSGPIDIGTDTEIGALLANVMSDRDARVMLGVAVGALRDERLARSLSANANAASLPAVIAAQLADVDAMTDALTNAAAHADAADDARRATLLSQSRSALLLLGQIGSLAIPGARLVVGGITTTAREVIDLVMAATPTSHDANDLSDQLMMATRVGFIAMLSAQPSLWPGLGLSEVAHTLWEEIGDHVRRFNAAVDDVTRAQSYADLLAVVADSVPLSTIVNTVRALANR